MPWWNRNAGSYDSNRTWEDTVAASLLDEADWAQADGDFGTPVHLDAYPDEGAVYVSDSEGDEPISCSFHYSDTTQADDELLTHLNSTWGW